MLGREFEQLVRRRVPRQHDQSSAAVVCKDDDVAVRIDTELRTSLDGHRDLTVIGDLADSVRPEVLLLRFGHCHRHRPACLLGFVFLMDLLETIDLEDLVGMMLAAGGPAVIPARIEWPLHRALHDLHERAGRCGLRSQLPQLSFRPCPDVAVRAAGGREAMFSLARRGTLDAEGTGRQAVLRLAPDARVKLRRELMRLDPETVRLVQWGATRWAALVATSAKNRSTARRSPGSTVASDTPKRLHEPPGIASNASSRLREPRSTRLVTR